MTKLRVLIMCFLHLMDYSIKHCTLGGGGGGGNIKKNRKYVSKNIGCNILVVG
jgi:hypothetical protein